MKMKWVFLFLLKTVFFTTLSAQPAKEVVEKMLRSINQVNTLKYKLKTFERIGEKYRSSEQDVKYAKSPLRFYIYSIKPDKGAEVLYNPAVNKKEVLVNPNAFPYVNLYINPYSSLLRKNRHHTSFDVGFDYFASIVNHLMRQSGSNFEKFMKLDGDVKFNSRDCYKLIMEYPDYRHINYTVKKGETVTSIANKLYVNDYKILELNKSVKDYDDVHTGQVIKVPTIYSKRVVIYIDKKTYLPLMQEMHDEKGLYERFEFLNVQVNPHFQANEFSKEFKEYKF